MMLLWGVRQEQLSNSLIFPISLCFVLGKAHMSSTPSLKNVPNVAPQACSIVQPVTARTPHSHSIVQPLTARTPHSHSIVQPLTARTPHSYSIVQPVTARTPHSYSIVQPLTARTPHSYSIVQPLTARTPQGCGPSRRLMPMPVPYHQRRATPT